MARSFLITVAVASMDRSTETMANPLDSALLGADIKGACRAYQHAPHIRSLLRTSRNDRLNYIPGLESLDLLCPLWFRAGEAHLVHIAHLPTTISLGGDQQGNHASHPDLFRGTLAHTRGVYPMFLWQSTQSPVELGETS